MSVFTIGIEAFVVRVIEKKLALRDANVYFDSFREVERRERELLSRLIRDGWVQPYQLKRAVEEALKRLANEMYFQVERLGRPPDHVDSPAALAYGIKTGLILSHRILWLQRRLDHGETLDEFKRRGDDLLESCIEQLKTGPSTSRVSFVDKGPECEHCDH